MKTNNTRLVLLLITALQIATIFSADAQIIKTTNGIIIKAGNSVVGLSVANDDSFCLSLNNSGTPSIIKSTFIDDGNHTAAKFTIISAKPLWHSNFIRKIGLEHRYR